MLFELFVLVVIVSVVFISGFPFELDNIISNKSKFHHLPEKPFLCVLCMSFWTQAIWLLITGQFTLISLLTALLLAYAAPTIQNVIILIKSCLDRLVEAAMKVIG